MPPIIFGWGGVGTTSACAENTVPLGHMEVTHMELPPRARRIPHGHELNCKPNGTTSACAENTYDWLYAFEFAWNYLRVRGEYQKYQQPYSG